MLRKLLVITLLFSTVAVGYAQKKDRKKKKDKGNTEQASTDTAKIDYKAIGAPLPPLDITTRTGEKHTEKDFKNYKNLLVMMFNPTCDHCQEETAILEKNIEQFKDTKLLLIAAPSMIDYLEFYNNVTRYSKYPEITVGVDSAGFIDKTFTYTSLPQINIYDKDRKLVKIFSGVTQFDAIESFIK